MEKRSISKQWLAAFPARLYFSLIMLGVLGFGTWVNRRLLAIGMPSMVKRSMIAFPLSYAFFFILLWVWLNYFRPETEGIDDETVLRKNHVSESQEIESASIPSSSSSTSASTKRERSGGFLDFLDVFEAFDLSEGVAIALIVILVLGLLFIAYWLISIIISEGALVLVDAAFDAGLTAALLRKYRRADGPQWTDRVLNRTFAPFLIFWIVSGLFFVAGERNCPGATRTSQVLRCALHMGKR